MSNPSPDEGLAPQKPLSVAEIVARLKARELRLPFEIGAFLALEVAEVLVEESLCVVSPEQVFVNAEGKVLIRSKKTHDREMAARSVSSLLAHVLVASGAGVPAVLLRLVESGPTGADWNLERLRDELEASLIPLNRSAARRVLSRMLREVHAPARGGVAPGGVLQRVDPKDVDAELDAFLVKHATRDPSGDVSLRESAPEPEPAAQPELSSEPEEPVDSLPAEAVVGEELHDEHAPSEEESPRDDDRRNDPIGLDRLDEPRSSSATRGILFVVVAAAIATFLFLYLRGETEAPSAAPNAPPTTQSSPPEPSPPIAEPNEAPMVPTGSIVFRIRPPAANADVLLFVGRSPVTVERVPLGCAHEFVAIKEGHQPARAEVVSDAPFQETPNGFLYELPMQLVPREGADELAGLAELPIAAFESHSPRVEATGLVRILSHPSDAKIYRRVAAGPSAYTIESMRMDRMHEFLVRAPGFAGERVVVGPSDWSAASGAPSAIVTVVLQPVGIPGPAPVEAAQ